MSFVIEDVLVRNDPVGFGLPLVFDSPHSGVQYPIDFNFTCPTQALRQAEDTYVEELFAAAPEYGATLLAALFPRSYIDVNRAIDDIDPELIDGPWPEPIRPTDKCRAGIGLVRRLCRPGLPVYDGRLPVGLVMERIDRFYRPYHAQLTMALDRAHARFGAVWHINCHSMPSCAGPGGRGGLADFVLGDRDGTSCDADFLAFVDQELRDLGYLVAINDPYKGVELVRRHGHPARHRHSLQVEIRRDLYMNEDTLEKHAGFARLQADMTRLIGRLADFVRAGKTSVAAE